MSECGEHKVLRRPELRLIHLMISKYLVCNEQLIKMCAVAYASLLDTRDGTNESAEYKLNTLAAQRDTFFKVMIRERTRTLLPL